ncbi:MAG: sigma-70 family RNA polymerase sigma factor [Acidobacteriota bacterium]
MSGSSASASLRESPDLRARLVEEGVAELHLDALIRLVERRSRPLSVEEAVDEYRHWRLFEEGRRGDPAQAATFADYWRRRVRRTLARRFEEELVDELTARFFERVFRLVPEDYDWRVPFSAYLQTVVANLVRDALRERMLRRQREEELSDGEDGGPPIVSELPTPERAALSFQRSEALERAFAALPPMDRLVLRSVLVEGRSGQDLAVELGLKRQALYMRLNRAKQKLREELLALGLERRELCG